MQAKAVPSEQIFLSHSTTRPQIQWPCVLARIITWHNEQHVWLIV